MQARILNQMIFMYNLITIGIIITIIIKPFISEQVCILLRYVHVYTHIGCLVNSIHHTSISLTS